MLWNSPISEERFEAMARRLDLARGDRVLDVGCGTGEMLMRLAERYGILGVGIDRSRESIQKARSNSATRFRDAPIEWIDGDAAQFEGSGFDAALCVGATHAFGMGADAFGLALDGLSKRVKPGGLLLVGEAAMKRRAPAEYRRLLKGFPPDSMTHASNVETVLKHGLQLVTSWSSTDAEWDAFEYAHQAAAEAAARAHPNDRQAQEKLDFRREWIEAYELWGRNTLGFVVYLVRVKAPAASSGV